MAQFFHHNEFGYCARCPRTQHLHLCFGNLALAATTDDFFLFKEHIAEIYYEHHLLPIDPEERCIAVRTPVQKMAMVFTAIELGQLWEILQNTALLLEVEKILANGSQE